MQNYSGGSNGLFFLHSRLLHHQKMDFKLPAAVAELRSTRHQVQLTADFPEDSQTSETILRNKRGDRQVEKSETAGDLIANIREGNG